MTCNTAQHGGFFSSTGYVCTCMCVFLFCYGLTTCSMEGPGLLSCLKESVGNTSNKFLQISHEHLHKALVTGQHVTCCICRSVEGKKGGMGWLEEYKKKKRNAKRSAPYCLRILRCQLWHMDMNLYLWQKELTGKAHWGFNGSLCWSVISFNSAWYKKKKKINQLTKDVSSVHALQIWNKMWNPQDHEEVSMAKQGHLWILIPSS